VAGSQRVLVRMDLSDTDHDVPGKCPNDDADITIWCQEDERATWAVVHGGGEPERTGGGKLMRAASGDRGEGGRVGIDAVDDGVRLCDERFEQGGNIDEQSGICRDGHLFLVVLDMRVTLALSLWTLSRSHERVVLWFD